MILTSTLIGALPSNAFELLLLQGPQELDLHAHGNIADLVEKERAAIRELEAPELGLDCPGKRALLMAKELALEQRLGERSAVDLDEGPFLSLAAVVNGSGDELLAGTTLAPHEDRGVGSRDLLDGLEDLLHRHCPAHQVCEAIAPFGLVSEVVVLGLQLVPVATRTAQLEGALHLEAHDLRGKWLGQEVESTELHGLHRGLHRAESSDDHGRNIRVELADGLEDGDTVHPLHLEVGDDEVDIGVLLEEVDPAGSPRGCQSLVAHSLDGVREPFANGLVVVNDEDLCAHASLVLLESGMRTIKRVPRSASDSTSIVPL